MFVRQNSIDFEKDGITKSGYLFVPEYMDQVSDFLVLKNRVTQERYALSNDGVIITEKLARLLGVSAGDQIILKDSDTMSHTVTVEAIAENYLYHYVYMTPALYEQLYGSEPDYNKLLLKFQDTSKEAQEQLGNELLSDDRISSVSFVTELESKVQDMMRSLDLVVWVLIISAGLLAFVVLYNLNNINVTERRRELATIKVLGFYDNEVAEYVYRENVFLTVFGIIAEMCIRDSPKEGDGSRYHFRLPRRKPAASRGAFTGAGRPGLLAFRPGRSEGYSRGAFTFFHRPKALLIRRFPATWLHHCVVMLEHTTAARTCQARFRVFFAGTQNRRAARGGAAVRGGSLIPRGSSWGLPW